ncbi:cell wall biogenesis and architecture protein [Saxophila tyrrhenica]|uniref:3-methyl-2-oxobutanoate hydroxymethyltransferase n=1 Tax=Saxophila tyrrhenica TaxID=1690608 RepID=A0AAV9P2T7_9PEZI|nr:cell wall biogenesis and architecture protein [Saxophila tyrrhenica]
MLTAHDFPSAHVADTSGIDMILVGDSLAMVALGMDDTSEIRLEEMILHCRSVARGAKASFLVGDLPMGSYEVSPEQALESAIKVVKEGRMQAVKLEGGAEMAPAIRKITTAGISVLAHIGLTPQRQNALGGFRVQGKNTTGALKVLRDAVAVQDAGAFGVVLEAVPAEVAALVTRKLRIPTIGIGAGSGCSGQVLVQMDMSGNFPPGRFLPKFVKKFGDVWGEAQRAAEAYRDEVKAGTYPAVEHTYPMPKEEYEEFERRAGQIYQSVLLSCQQAATATLAVYFSHGRESTSCSPPYLDGGSTSPEVARAVPYRKKPQNAPGAICSLTPYVDR